MATNNTKEIWYWTFVFIMNYLPTIAFHLIVRPMWFKGVDSSTSATTYELFFTIVLLPIYLVVTNYILATKYKKTMESFILNSIIIVTCIFISTELHLKNWSDGTGRASADSGTEAVMEFERITGIIVSLIGLIIVFLHLKKRTT